MDPVLAVAAATVFGRRVDVVLASDDRDDIRSAGREQVLGFADAVT
jgi:hypothetical protein